MAAPVTLSAGTVLAGRFRVLEALGSGGQAVAYLGEDLRDGGRCVIKELRVERAGEWKAVELFEREAKVLARLSHARVPRFIDAWTENEGGRLYLVEGFAEGETLAALVRRGRRFEERQIIDFALAVAEVLRDLHDEEPPVIHRDLKPSNLMVRDGGPDRPPELVALLDFGAVREGLRLARQTGSAETVAGSYGYMPIEQFEGQALPASDIYALGATLLFLLSHREPSTMLGTDGRLRFEPYVEVSPGLAAVLARMLAPRPTERYATAALLIADLCALRAGQALVVARPRPERSQTIVWRSLTRLRSRRGLAAAALAFVASLGLWRACEPGITTVKSFREQVSHLAFAGEDHVLAASRDGTLGLWRVPGGSLAWSARVRQRTTALAVAPSGDRFARGTDIWDDEFSRGLPPTVELRAVPDGRRLQSFPAERQTVAALAFAPDRRSLAVAANDRNRREHFEHRGELRIFRLDGAGLVDVAAEPRRLTRNGQPIVAIAFSPDSRTLAYLSRRFSPERTHQVGSETVLVDLATSREAACPLPDTLLPIHVGFAPDGQSLVVTDGATESVLLLDRACRVLRTLRPDRDDVSYRAFAGAVFLPGGTGLLAPLTTQALLPWAKLPWLRSGAEAVRAIAVYDRASGRATRRLPLRTGFAGHAAQSLAQSPRGRYVAAGYGDIYEGGFKLWRLR